MEIQQLEHTLSQKLEKMDPLYRATAFTFFVTFCLIGIILIAYAYPLWTAAVSFSTACLLGIMCLASGIIDQPEEET